MTLNFKLNTKPVEDYGNLTVVLANAKQFPVIIELTNGDVLASEFTEEKLQ
jgi:hypothetical protein